MLSLRTTTRTWQRCRHGSGQSLAMVTMMSGKSPATSAAAASTMIPSPVTEEEKRADESVRREKFYSLLPPRSAVLMKANTRQVATNDIQELWDGPTIGAEGALERFGCDSAYPLGELARVLPGRLAGVGRLFADMASRPLLRRLGKADGAVAKALQDGVETPRRVLAPLRARKSPLERRLLRHAAEVAADALVEVIKSTKPGMSEHELDAQMEWECKRRGADGLSYIPVVAGGKNACVMHYIANNKVLKDGDMILMDAGCERDCYASDITRCWPVGGRFSPAQRRVYEAVLRVQERALAFVGVGRSLSEVNRVVRDNFIEEELRELIGSKAAGKGSHYMPHSVGHHLGMDVHDVPDMSSSIPMEEGFSFTVEPGLYFHAGDESVPEELRGIGVRIEDDVIIDSDGSIVVTTSGVPKDCDTIEALMAGDV